MIRAALLSRFRKRWRRPQILQFWRDGRFTIDLQRVCRPGLSPYSGSTPVPQARTSVPHLRLSRPVAILRNRPHGRFRKRWRRPQILQFCGDSRRIRRELMTCILLIRRSSPRRKTARCEAVAIFYEIVYCAHLILFRSGLDFSRKNHVLACSSGSI